MRVRIKSCRLAPAFSVNPFFYWIFGDVAGDNHCMKYLGRPSRGLVAAVMAMALTGGVAAGVGAFTFIYARGASYLTDNPEACANCHIMDDHYDAWLKSSHKDVATCNDCHTPHALVPKYIVKGINGFNHALAFTTMHFKEPIEITGMNRRVTENACRRCHGGIVAMIDMDPLSDETMSCVRCHFDVGHAAVRSGAWGN